MQQTFAEAGFEQYRKSTRRERFLDEMNRVVPWVELVAVIEPVSHKADGPGRPREGSSASAIDRRGAGQESDKVEGPGQSLTCVLGDQADLRLGQSPLSRAGEEYPLAPGQLRLGESLSDPAATGGRNIEHGCLGANRGPSDGDRTPEIGVRVGGCQPHLPWSSAQK